MLAKLKDTGEVVNIINLYDDGTAETESHNYIKVSKLFIDFHDNDYNISSEKRMKFELVKTAMPSMLESKYRTSKKFDEIVSDAISIADEVLKQLKESWETK